MKRDYGLSRRAAHRSPSDGQPELKPRNLQRNNRISVCIYDPPVASNYVVITGTATCNDQSICDEARCIIERYRVLGEVDDYLVRWRTEPRVLVTVTPERISTRASGRR
jgi:hypothetical protein